MKIGISYQRLKDFEMDKYLDTREELFLSGE
jgi:hypothetical protein